MKILRVLFVLLLLIPLTISHAGDVGFNLEWDAPITNTDGTPLTDLAGFNTYYSLISGEYNSGNMVNIPDPTQTAVTIILPYDLMWYLVVTAYDTSGNESIYSDEVALLKVTPDVMPPSGCSNLTVN